MVLDKISRSVGELRLAAVGFGVGVAQFHALGFEALLNRFADVLGLTIAVAELAFDHLFKLRFHRDGDLAAFSP